MAVAAQAFDTFAYPKLATCKLAPIPSLVSARAGHAEVCAHHGEIVQGVFYSNDGSLEHALVTLPCPLFCACVRFHPVRSGPLIIEPRGRVRALVAARLTLEALGYTEWGGYICIESNVPLCWGCGSSTSDVVATIRAVADAFNVILEGDWIARLAVLAETASDSLMYRPDRTVLFAQRRGSILFEFGGPLPAVHVLGFNTAENQKVETLRLPPMPYSSWEIEAFRPLLGLLRRSIEQQDPSLLGRVATASTVITQRHRPKKFMPRLLKLAAEVGALGTQVAHSGTVAGFLFECKNSADNIERARAGLNELGLQNWEFTTQTL